jgi:hypothetical protein
METQNMADYLEPMQMDVWTGDRRTVIIIIF